MASLLSWEPLGRRVRSSINYPGRDAGLVLTRGVAVYLGAGDAEGIFHRRRGAAGNYGKASRTSNLAPGQTNKYRWRG